MDNFARKTMDFHIHMSLFLGCYARSLALTFERIQLTLWLFNLYLENYPSVDTYLPPLD